MILTPFGTSPKSLPCNLTWVTRMKTIKLLSIIKCQKYQPRVNIYTLPEPTKNNLVCSSFVFETTEVHWYQGSYIKLSGGHQITLSGGRHLMLSGCRHLKLYGGRHLILWGKHKTSFGCVGRNLILSFSRETYLSCGLQIINFKWRPPYTIYRTLWLPY